MSKRTEAAFQIDRRCVMNSSAVTECVGSRPVDEELSQIFRRGFVPLSDPVGGSRRGRPPPNMWISHLCGKRSCMRVNNLRGVSPRCCSFSSLQLSITPLRKSTHSSPPLHRFLIQFEPPPRNLPNVPPPQLLTPFRSTQQMGKWLLHLKEQLRSISPGISFKSLKLT